MIRLVDFQHADLPKLALDVLCHQVIVLKNAISPDMIRSARKAVHQWSRTSPQSKSKPHENGGASHLISYLPPRSESRYIEHDYEFDPLSDAEIVKSVLPVFDRMRVIYCDLLGASLAFGESYEDWTFRPQIIQYPRGGGFFQEHFHSLTPQRIGMVLSGSIQGEDYKTGGGRFRASDGTWMSTENNHDVGDITLFRYDIGHDITPIDPDERLDWSSESGRWSFILPLKPH